MQTRERFIPKGSTEVQHPQGLGVVYTYPGAHSHCAMGYEGKRAKRSWAHAFTSEAVRDGHIDFFFSELTQKHAARKTRAAERNRPHTCQPGDVFVYSWGWEQTNIEFFQVTRATERSVWLRKIASKETEYGPQAMCGTSIPLVREFLPEEEIRKQVTVSGDRIFVNMPHGSGSPWDGTPQRWTGYA